MFDIFMLSCWQHAIKSLKMEFITNQKGGQCLMEWEQIHAQQDNGKRHGLLKVLQKILPSKNHYAWGPATATNKWAQSSCGSGRIDIGCEFIVKLPLQHFRHSGIRHFDIRHCSYVATSHMQSYTYMAAVVESGYIGHCRVS